MDWCLSCITNEEGAVWVCMSDRFQVTQRWVSMAWLNGRVSQGTAATQTTETRATRWKCGHFLNDDDEVDGMCVDVAMRAIKLQVCPSHCGSFICASGRLCPIHRPLGAEGAPSEVLIGTKLRQGAPGEYLVCDTLGLFSCIWGCTGVTSQLKPPKGLISGRKLRHAYFSLQSPACPACFKAWPCLVYLR